MFYKLLSILSIPFVATSAFLHAPAQLEQSRQVVEKQAQVIQLQKELIDRMNVTNQVINSKLGAYNPSGGNTYRLQSSIGTTDTSISLSSFKEPISGIAYTMSYLNSDIEYGTLDPANTSKKEFISFTGITQNSDGTATLTGVTRGLAFSSPFTASTTLAQTHAGQSIFILSNTPTFYSEFATRQNNTIIPGYWNFSFRPYATSSSATSSSQFVTLGDLNSVSITGAATATESIMGISVLATHSQVGNGTASTTSGQPLIIPAKIASSSPFGSANIIPTTDANGYISQRFIGTTSAYSYIWNASTTFTNSVLTISAGTTTFRSATTTFATTTRTDNLDRYPLIQIGTSTIPSVFNNYGGVVIGTSTYIGNALGVGYATTTASSSEFANVAVNGSCSGCFRISTSTTKTALNTTGVTTATAVCPSNTIPLNAAWEFRDSASNIPNQTDGTDDYVVMRSAAYSTSPLTWTASIECQRVSASCSSNTVFHLSVYCAAGGRRD